MSEVLCIYQQGYLSDNLNVGRKKTGIFADSVDRKVGEDATTLELQLVAGLPLLLEPSLPVDQETGMRSTEGGLLTCLQQNGSNVLLEELERCLSPTRFTNLPIYQLQRQHALEWKKEIVIYFLVCFRLSTYSMCVAFCASSNKTQEYFHFSYFQNASSQLDG